MKKSLKIMSRTESLFDIAKHKKWLRINLSIDKTTKLTFTIEDTKYYPLAYY